MRTRSVPVVVRRHRRKASKPPSPGGLGHTPCCANALRYCASRKMKYFGYKLVMLSTLDGIPIAYDLVAANTDERQAVVSIYSCIITISLRINISYASHNKKFM